MSGAVFSRIPYLLYVTLVGVGLYMILSHRNLFKSLVGLALVQSGIILLFIMLAARRNATVPILPRTEAVPPLHNPLPHALMLTAIVVGVATLGLGISILLRLQAEEGRLEDAPDTSEER
jgi:multicomponent Na+:H+ antiporter subunit C